jgi:hypothetical protein
MCLPPRLATPAAAPGYWQWTLSVPWWHSDVADMWRTTSVIAVMVVAGAGAAAAEPARTIATAAPEPPLERTVAVHLEVASSLHFNSAGISVSYRPVRAVAVSAGFGGGMIEGVTDDPVVQGPGGQIAGHLLLGGESGYAEVALGVGIHADRERECGIAACTDDWDVGLAPYFFIGFRYQPTSLRASGFSYRVGFGGITYGFGGGLIVGVGRAF